MKTCALLLMAVFALLIFGVSAQEPTPEYRLRAPTAEEYLNQVIEIATENDGDNLGLYSTVTTILFNFPELYEAGFDRLLEAYNRMNIGSGQFWQRRKWVNILIHAWLSENQPDLNTVDRLDFADFYIGVIPRDLDGDSQNEFVLDVMKGTPVDRHECPSIDVVEYLTVKQTGHEYTFIDNPLGWYGRGSGGGSHLGEGGQLELRFEDVNADSLPEWIVAENNGILGGPDAGYANNGQLYILSYRDGQLVDLARNADNRGNVYSVTDYSEDGGWCFGPIPRTVSWEFANMDSDPALEILQHQDYRDNWYCESRNTQTLDWNPEADQYQYLHTDQSFADTRNCAHRLAEEAMWAGDYPKAIEQYKRALTLEPYRYNFPENYSTEHADYVAQENERLHHILTRLDQYLRARLILAYVLTGQPDQAQPLLNELAAEKMETQLMGYFVDALKSAPVSDPLQTCLAVYDVFTQHFPAFDTSLYDSEIYGDTVQGEYYAAPVYDPARVSCDAPTIIMQWFEAHPLSTETIPTAYLESIGIRLYYTLTADLNGDSQDDWLIWPESLMPPFFFAPVGDQYTVSQPALDPYRRSDGVIPRQLPENSGIGLVYLYSDIWITTYKTPWACVYIRNCGVGGGYCYPELNIWQMQGTELKSIFRERVCAENLTSIFTNGDTSRLNGGNESYEDGRQENHQYLWDNEQQAYLPYPPLTPTPVFTLTPEPPIETYSSVWGAFVDKGYAYVIEHTPSIRYSTETTFTWFGDYYYRALALEALNRPDEALAEYVAIAEAAPDSAWAKLAALHFERVERP